MKWFRKYFTNNPYNESVFKLFPATVGKYINFIKTHRLFIEEIFIKTEIQPEVQTKIIKRVTPSLDERGTTRINELHRAKRIKDDEFYTQYEDIEKELIMYPVETWYDKVVYCNCDDAVGDNEKSTSPFALYFLQNFKKLNIKKLICTHFAGKIDLFNAGSKAYIFTKEGFSENLFEGDYNYPERYDGSFDHKLSLKILNEEADIICTNPPFSRAIDYWKIIIESGKKFLIISNIVNPISTWCIPYFKNKKVWAGYNRVDWFLNPKREKVEAGGHWYTNLTIENRAKYELLRIMPLKEIPNEYKKYDDTGLLLVGKGYIPNDYKGVFAVSARPILNGLLEKGYKIANDKQYDPSINGKTGFKRVLIEKIS